MPDIVDVHIDTKTCYSVCVGCAGPSDQELAEEEEVEAIALQRQMAEELAEGAYAAPEKVVRCVAVASLSWCH